ncbi:MAG: M14 family zinc carboxypeptidase [Chitinophagales bacterium]
MKKTSPNNQQKYEKPQQSFRNDFFLIISFSICLFLVNTAYSYDRLSTVKIYLPKSVAERNDLLSILEIDHYQEKNGTVLVTLNEAALLKLKAYKCKYDLITKDATTDLEFKNKDYYSGLTRPNTNSANRVALEQNGQVVNNIITTPSTFQIKPTLGGYYSFSEMNSAMDALVAAYPNIAQKFSIGQSVEGREMWCIKISDNVSNDDTDEPELLYMGLHHAREAISGSSMIFFMQYLCENYGSNTSVTDLVNNREFFIIPCVNPDGWEYNRTTNPNGGGQWRKNRKNNGDGTYGVDLNRNWGIDWANCSGAIGSANCGSALGSSEVYWGTSAYSEPETVNLKNFVQSRHFAICMDQHSVGPYYSLPFGRIYRTLNETDNQIYTQVTSIMAKYNGMRYGNTYQTLGYEVSGGMKDWLLIGDTLNIGKIYGMTSEGGNGSSTTQFWPIAADIIQLCKGMIYQNLQIAYTAGSYVDFQDIGSINVTALNGKFYFKIRRIGLENKPVTITVLPIQNINSVGSPKTVASLPDFNSTYTDSITYQLPAGLANGKTIKFAWKIETGGYTYYDTVANIYNASVLFSDNAESGNVNNKWTVSSSWAYSTDEAFGGSKSLAESPNGTLYTNGSVRTITSKTNLNLSGASTAYISFWVKHRCENYQDKLQLQVSTNGTTWIALSGLTTIREPGTNDGSSINGIPSMTGIRDFWTREIFNLSDYLGNSALRFRLHFTSDAPDTYTYGTDKGFNIDNIIAISSSVNPNSFKNQTQVNLSGKNETSGNVLQFEAQNAAKTKQYFIERSTNGKDYELLDIRDALSSNEEQFVYIDNKPYLGENLYRVKVLENDGTVRYTNLVSLNERNSKLLPSGIQNIFPNPTDGNIQINFNVNEEQSTYNLAVFSISGQVIYNETLKLNAGQHNIQIDASAFAKGEYLISFSNPSSRVSYESKFMKL